MKTYIALLRGINVSGKNKILMKDLQSVLERINLGAVRTYIQSGNIVFESEQNPRQKLSELISNAIYDEFEYDVAVLVYERSELTKIVNSNPWLQHQENEDKFFHVSFLNDFPDKENFEEVVAKKSEKEDIAFDNKVVFLYCPDGYGRTKLTNSFLEKKLKTKATTRNWNTINKLLAMANKSE